MIAKETTSVPVALEKVRRRLERWRRTRTYRRSPIPAALWSAAVAVARQHGLYTTSRVLRLDYTALKKRMPAAGEPASPAFIELTPAMGTCGCVIEIESPCGGTMRVRVNGVALPDLVALTRVVWSGTV